jgi:hypothetical protein
VSVTHRKLHLRALVAAASGLVVVSLFVPSTAASAEEGPPGGEVLVGELVQAWPEYEDPAEAAEHGAEGPLSWIETEPGQAVRVPTEDVEDIPLGATVEVTLGETVADEASEEGNLEPAREVLEAEVLGTAPAAPAVPEPAPATTLVTNDVTVVRVVPQGGAPDATTITQIVDAVNGPVHDFWAEQSDAAIQIAATGWADWVPTTAGCTTPFAIWNEVATVVGFQAGDGKHLMLYIPNDQPGLAACAFGLGTMGTAVGSGGLFYARGLLTSVIAHELGHNFGLGHSSGRQCDASPDAGTCRTVAYRDHYDVMGISWEQVGSLNVPQAARLGLLPAGQQASVGATTAGALHTLAPVSGRTGTRGIRLTDSSGVTYWLEYRPAAGRDDWLASTTLNRSGLQSGVLLRRAVNDPHDTSWLLDGSPSAQGGWNADMQAALPVGAPVAVAGGRFRVTVQSVSATEAKVWIGGPAGLASGSQELPMGTLDSVTTTGSSISVSGWAFDPDTPTDALMLHVYIDGRGTAIVGANDRPDIARAFPPAGGRHGFSFSAPVSAGSHLACVFAIDSVGRGNSLLGCQRVMATPQVPIGSLDSVSGAASKVTVRGWTFDGDTPGSTVPVHVYIDGRGTAIEANTSRPDVGRAFPQAGGQHGFEFSTPATPGSHLVCVFAIDTEGIGNRLLDCRRITVVARVPIGSLDAVSVSGSTVTVSGWTFDPDTLTDATEIMVTVDTATYTSSASLSRPDVGRVYPAAGPMHGFTFAAPISPGPHRVCVYAIDTAGVGSSTLGCRSVTA